MIDSLIGLLGIDRASFHIDHNLLFVVSSTFILYSIGYMFNFFQTLMERLTAKKR